MIQTAYHNPERIMKYEDIDKLTPQEVALLCEQHIGKTYPFDNGLIYPHGRPQSFKVTSVRARTNIGGRVYCVDVYHLITFEDGYVGDYVMDGEAFLHEYHK